MKLLLQEARLLVDSHYLAWLKQSRQKPIHELLATPCEGDTPDPYGIYRRGCRRADLTPDILPSEQFP